MQQITGRLTADATVKDFESGKQVVNFNIAENQNYKTKDGEKVEVPTFFNCSYWVSTAIAKVLRKGAVVQLNGRMSARPYQTNTGDLGASLNFQANRIDILSYATDKGNQSDTTPAPAKNKKQKAKDNNGKDKADDMPF